MLPISRYKEKNMRYVLGIIFLAWCSLAGSFAATVDLNFSRTTLNVGETFTVEVRLTDVFGNADPQNDVLAGFGFNPAVANLLLLNLSSVSVNTDYFDEVTGPDLPTVAGLFNTLNFPAGITAADVVEPLRLATLTFTALAPGQTSVGITSDTSDPSQGLILFGASVLQEDLTSAGSLVTINEPVSNVIPEPSTWLMLGSSLGVLVFARRSRKA
jgi:hypothetical protein